MKQVIWRRFACAVRRAPALVAPSIEHRREVRPVPQCTTVMIVVEEVNFLRGGRTDSRMTQQGVIEAGRPASLCSDDHEIWKHPDGSGEKSKQRCSLPGGSIGHSRHSDIVVLGTAILAPR